MVKAHTGVPSALGLLRSWRNSTTVTMPETTSVSCVLGILVERAEQSSDRLLLSDSRQHYLLLVYAPSCFHSVHLLSRTASHHSAICSSHLVLACVGHDTILSTGPLTLHVRRLRVHSLYGLVSTDPSDHRAIGRRLSRFLMVRSSSPSHCSLHRDLASQASASPGRGPDRTA